ncbi:MAG: metallophosphoesterase [Clostridia bacterium]|nr:metallophosphoesterase [Clostridia bacterium]
MRRNRPVFAQRRERRTGCLVYPLLLALILAVSLALNFINNGRVQVDTQSVTVASLPKDLEKFRILHISDLHGNEFGADQSTIAAMLKGKYYDAVCITGDVCAPDGSYDAFLKLIDLFAPSVPVYFIAGDEDPEPIVTHSQGSDSPKADYVRAAEEHGAIYLDSPQKITVGKSVIWFCPLSMYGLDVDATRAAYQNRRDELTATDVQYTPDGAAQIRAIDYQLSVLDAIGQANAEMKEDDTQVVLTHHPLTSATIRTLQQWAGEERGEFLRGVSLVLAGHYNGGLIRLPFLGALKAPATADMPRGGWLPDDKELVGLSTVQGVTQYISPGLGVSSAYLLRLRLFNTPAVTILTLTATLQAVN